MRKAMAAVVLTWPAARGREPGARHLRIEVAVGDVVEGAAGAPHDDGADQEESGMPEVGQPAARRHLAQRQAPPAGQQQQPPADRPFQPHEPGIGPQRDRQSRSTQWPGRASATR